MVAVMTTSYMESVSNFPKFGHILFAWICSWLLFHTATVVGGDDHAYLQVKLDRSFNPILRGENCSSRIDCGLRCTSDPSCNAFNFVPPAASGQGVTGLCQLVNLNSNSRMNTTLGTEAWLQRTHSESGSNVRVDVDPNGNFFVGFREWGPVAYSDTSSVCSQLGAGIASASSMTIARFFNQLMIPNNDMWVFSGMDDFRSKSLFSDYRGLEPPEENFLINGPDGGINEPCLALVLYPLSSGTPPWLTDTDCTMMKNPWICEFPRLQDFGCHMEPLTPLGAQLAPNTALPAPTGSKVSFICSDPAQKFVNGNVSPTVTCRGDGYWNKSEPFYPCTGGADYYKDPNSAACYISNRGRDITILSADTYCRRMGGIVLTYTDSMAWVFPALMSKGGGVYYDAFAGYMKNATGSGAITDIYGQGHPVLDATWNDGDNTANESYIYVYAHMDGMGNVQWSFYDFNGYTKDRKFICKFENC